MSSTELAADRSAADSLDQPAEITDPKALRALAHPARIAILQHLALDGPATATECADIAGLSPSACSYHLRALARYGFVTEEPAGAADGRHRPWRARMVAVTIGEEPDRPEAARAAGRLLVETVQGMVSDLRADYLDHEAQYPRDWQLAAGMRQDVLHLTAAELTDVRTRIAAILADYRRLQPDDQPAGARRVHAIVEFLPWFSPDAGPPQDSDGQGGA